MKVLKTYKYSERTVDNHHI